MYLYINTSIPSSRVMVIINLYTDGGARRQPDGSWLCAWAYYIPQLNVRSSNMLDKGTNNQAELSAILFGLEYLRDQRVTDVRIISDSDYSIKILTEYLPKRQRSGTHHTLKNLELLLQIQTLTSQFSSIWWKHVRSHLTTALYPPGQEEDYINNSIVDQEVNICIDQHLSRRRRRVKPSTSSSSFKCRGTIRSINRSTYTRPKDLTVESQQREGSDSEYIHLVYNQADGTWEEKDHSPDSSTMYSSRRITTTSSDRR